MANFGSLAAETCCRLCGTPTNFNGFCILASLLQRRRSSEANQTLRDVGPSPGLVHYIYLFGRFCPWRNFTSCKIHFTFKSCVHLYCQRYSSSGVSQALQRGTRNGITELSQRAPPTFARVAVTLGIGPHSGLSCGFFFLLLLSSFFLASSRRRLDVYHTCTHGVALV